MKYLPPLLNHESFVLYILLRILNRTRKEILYNLIVTEDDEKIIYIYKKSLKIPKGGNQNPYIEEEQTTQ